VRRTEREKKVADGTATEALSRKKRGNCATSPGGRRGGVRVPFWEDIGRRPFLNRGRKGEGGVEHFLFCYSLNTTKETFFFLRGEIEHKHVTGDGRKGVVGPGSAGRKKLIALAMALRPLRGGGEKKPSPRRRRRGIYLSDPSPEVHERKKRPPHLVA